MDLTKSWADTFNAAVTGLSQNQNGKQDVNPQHIVQQAKAIADLAFPFHHQNEEQVLQLMKQHSAQIQQNQAQQHPEYSRR